MQYSGLLARKRERKRERGEKHVPAASLNYTVLFLNYRETIFEYCTTRYEYLASFFTFFCMSVLLAILLKMVDFILVEKYIKQELRLN